MLQHTAICRVPVDIAAAFGFDGSPVTLENLGITALRFVVADAAGEAALADRGAGNLLEPGDRANVEPGGTGVPLWAWSVYPTRIGCSRSWGIG